MTDSIRYRNFDSLLDDLNANIQMPFGVRRLTTPMGRTSIHDIDQLQHLGKAEAGRESFRSVFSLLCARTRPGVQLHPYSVNNLCFETDFFCRKSLGLHHLIRVDV
ncbi:unnamed protein product [Heligmosomoides polygyrus]|uniref:Doublecortin domain-containing protein n=1 Tax=Heligmosomoides polygyrus TaxID=6339 RepID=A0A3P7ZSE9_HELPZ|nr:unnamed protein product [Heligmosomoides polygyrus]